MGKGMLCVWDVVRGGGRGDGERVLMILDFFHIPYTYGAYDWTWQVIVEGD